MWSTAQHSDILTGDYGIVAFVEIKQVLEYPSENEIESYLFVSIHQSIHTSWIDNVQHTFTS